MRAIVKIEKKSRVKLFTGIMFMLLFNLNSRLSAAVQITGQSYPCAGSVNNYAVNVGSIPSGYALVSITWTVTGGTGTPVLNGNGQATQINVVWNSDPVTGNTTGALSVTVVKAQFPSGANATFESDNETIHITGIANAGAVQGPNSVCTQHAATFYVNPIPGATAYQWTLPFGWTWVPNTSHTGNSIQIVAPAYGATSNLSVVGTDPSCGALGNAAVLSLSSVLPPALNFGNNWNIYFDSPKFELPMSSDGYWSGPGVTEDKYFQPSLVGVGMVELTYSYTGMCPTTKKLVINIIPDLKDMTALDFEGSQVVTIPPNNDLGAIGNGDFTIETWVKFPSTTAGGQILCSNVLPFPPYANSGMVFYINNNKQLALSINSTAPILSAPLPNLYNNACQHLAITRSGGIITFYFNGNTYPVVSGAANAGLNINSILDILTIGDVIGGYSQASALKGTMDEFRLWNVPRAASAIQADKNTHIPPTPGLIGYWDFNEGGNTVHDVSGAGHDGFLGTFNATPPGSSGAPTRVQWSCYYNGETGLYYDGSTKYATISAGNPLYFNPGTGPFSLEMQARLEPCNCSKDQVLISNKTNNNPTSGFVWYVKNGTHLAIEFANGGNPVTIVSSPFPGGANLFDQSNRKCYDFAIVRDQSGMVTFYISGITLNGGVCNADINTSEPFYLGYDEVTSDGHAEFHGIINEARFWLAAKTAAQIGYNQNMVLSPASIGWPEWTDLVGYYPMKEHMGEQRIFDGSWVGMGGSLGDNTSVEIVDPTRTYDGCFYGDRLAKPDESLNSTDADVNNHSISIYPNPFQDEFKVVIKDYVPGNYVLEVFDTSNRLIYTKTVDTSDTVLRLESDLTPGFYLLKVTDPENKTRTFKLIRSGGN